MTDTVLDQSACTNCGTRLTGMFCAHCGRKADAGPPTMREFLRDGAEELFDVNGKVLRTLRALFLRPGFLTRELFEGRRAAVMFALTAATVPLDVVDSRTVRGLSALSRLVLTLVYGVVALRTAYSVPWGTATIRATVIVVAYVVWMFVFVFGTVMLYGLL